MQLYYIHDGEVKKGPFDLEHLRDQSLNAETPVWREGLLDWMKAGDLEELRSLFISSSTPPPIPKSFNKNVPVREMLINSFSDAEEILPDQSKNSLLLSIILTIVIIAGIIFTILHYR